MITTLESHHERAAEIASLNFPGNYSDHYQPTYSNMSCYRAVLAQLVQMPGITSVESIQATKQRLGSSDPVVIFGSCHTPLQSDQADLGIRLVEPIVSFLDTVEHSNLPSYQALYRGVNFFKPRTNEFEQIPEGKILSHMGDGVNRDATHQRDPNPRLLVSAAQQGRETFEYFNTLPFQIPVGSAHEGLHVGFEESFTRFCPDTGKMYNLSSDFVWVGYRSNHLDSPQTTSLAKVLNPKGVKLGPKNTSADVRDLTEMLNPGREPGGLVFMLRFGKQHRAEMRDVISGIQKYSENARVMVDMHCLPKVRLVAEFIEEMSIVAELLASEGIPFGGVSLETVEDDSRLECIDEAGQQPTHSGNIDSRLNPRQTLEVCNHLATLVS